MRFALYHTGEELCIDDDGSWCDPNDPYMEGVLSSRSTDVLEIFDIIEIATGYNFSEIYKEILILDVSDLDFENPVWEGGTYESCVDARWALIKIIKDLRHKYDLSIEWNSSSSTSGSTPFIVTYADTSTCSST